MAALEAATFTLLSALNPIDKDQPVASLEDIMLALGKVQNGIETLREDFQEEKQAARQSRAVIHERLDEQAEQIARIDKTVAIAGMIEAQTRDRVEALTATVEANATDVAEWRRIKRIGLGITGLLAVGGLSVGAVLVWASDTAAILIRHWLRIP